VKNLKIFTNNIEDSAKQQIDLLLEQEVFKDCKVRIMPDVHAGSGCVIGFTGDLGDKVIPNIVGVDIGCGMLCVKLGKVDLDLEKLDNVIRNYIPSGMNVRDVPCSGIFSFKILKCYKELKNKDNWLEKSMGTLGGGNHFIEVDIDEDNNKYLVIHTGSRNLGKQVCDIYQNKAIEYCSYKEEMKKEKEKIIKEYKEQGREKEIQQALVDINNKYVGKTKLPKDLCYIEGQLREDYLYDMKICQSFAESNRNRIAREIISRMGLNEYVEDMFQCVHNYINFEDNIVRKGAISARKGERVLIPMNMRDGCIIGVGKGNEDWNNSAPHGAGRIMSRMKAKGTFNLDEFEESMNGIYTTSVGEDTIDEAPFVYKPMEEIINSIGDTVEIERIIKPIYNFKANE
jgi:RNA-splicing ligase RtcB